MKVLGMMESSSSDCGDGDVCNDVDEGERKKGRKKK